MKNEKGVFCLNKFPSYKGGDTCLYGGYVYEYLPNQYPHIQNYWGWCPQHRVVGEDIAGRKLRKSKDPSVAECVHHKNEIRTDNSPSNLQVMTMSEHRRHHAKQVGDRCRKDIDVQKMQELLQTKSIKETARELGVHHMTIRNRYPDMIKHKKRRSPEKIDDPQIIETVLFFAPDSNYAIYDVERLTGISARSILRICKRNQITWVHKQRPGRPKKTSQMS